MKTRFTFCDICSTNHEEPACTRIEAEPPPPAPFATVPTNSTIHRTITEWSRLLGRRLEAHIGPTDVVIVQRCRVCAAEIEVKRALFVAKLDDAGLAALGARIRKTYQMHRCAPIEHALVGYTWDELSELFETLEREGMACMERAHAIAAIMKTNRP